jgi:NitT/TauT family transport system substrate-binding protein
LEALPEHPKGNSMNQKPRFGVIPAVLMLLAALLSACGGSEQSDRGGGGNGLEKGTIKVAMLPIATAAPYYRAVKDKLFEAEGLKVETQVVQSSPQAYPALKNGAIDMVFANNSSMLLGQDKGDLPINLISEGTRLTPTFMAVLVMPNSPIKSIKDLAGRSVTVQVLNNIQVITLNAIAKANGLDPALIKYRQVVFPQMAPAMQKGDVDAIHVNEPFKTDALLKLGARMAVDGGAAPVTDLPMDGYFAVRGWAQKYPRTAAAFQRAMDKARAIAADRSKVEEVIPTYIRNADPQVTKNMTMPGFPAHNDPAAFQRLIDLMKDQGQLTNKLDATTIVYKPAA